MRMDHTLHLWHFKERSVKEEMEIKKVSSCIWENSSKEKKADHSHIRTKSLISQGCPNSGLNIIFCYYCFIHLLFPVLSGIGVSCKFQRVIWLPSQSPLIFLPHIWHYTVRKNSQYPFPKLRHFIQWPHHLEHWKIYFLEAGKLIFSKQIKISV